MPGGVALRGSRKDIRNSAVARIHYRRSQISESGSGRCGGPRVLRLLCQPAAGAGRVNDAVVAVVSAVAVVEPARLGAVG